MYDESRNRTRRWCEAGACGNLLKVRQFRERQARRGATRSKRVGRPLCDVSSFFAIGVTVLFLILAFRRASLVPPRDAVPMLLVMGFVGVFVHQLLQSYALTMTSAANTGWLIGMFFGTIMLAPFFLVSQKWHEWSRLV